MTAAVAVAAPAEGLPETVAFLKQTLPPEQPGAFYFVSEQDAGGRWRDHPVATIAEAARLALQFDAAGANAYFALAAFAPDSSAPSRVRRKQEQAISLRALFLDVDVGKPGAYATQEDARAELKRFCNATGLPLARSVASGKGLHLYWLLNEPALRDEWQGAADNLAALCAALNFKIDTACTTDAARVLRPVGTHWRKAGGPLPVRLLEDAPSVSFAKIKAILDDACRRHGGIAKERVPVVPKNPGNSINWAFEVRHIYPPANADLIAEACTQIREMRDTGGRISEPRWHACIGVLVCADNSDQVVQEWSNKHAKYRIEEAEDYIARARDFGHPTTCARFAEINREGCLNCVHNGRITSPIQLGNVHRLAPRASPQGESPPAAPQSSGSVLTAPNAALAFGAPVAVEPLFDIESARARRFFLTAPPPRTWILKDCLPAGIVGGIVAMGGTGKSQAMLQLAAAVATGLPFCDTWEIGEPGEVLALMAEDDEPELHRRMLCIARELERAHPGRNAESAIGRNCIIKSLIGGANLLTELKLDREVRQTSLVARVIATARQLGNLKLIIFDPVSRFRGGSENDAQDVTRFIETMERIRAAIPGATVLIVHHTNKWSSGNEDRSQNDARGSSAFSDNIRWQMNLAPLNKKETGCVPAGERHMYLSATVTKSNYAPPQPTLYLKRGEGGILLKADLAERVKRKEETITLQIVQKIAASEDQFSARSFANTFCGEGGIFGIGQNKLVQCVNQAIGHGYLKKDGTPRGLLCVTDLGKGVLQAGALLK
jgi:hypothetical protein